jgi:hypothetical protein
VRALSRSKKDVASMNGTYGFVYSGAVGVGMGVFSIKDDVITGADVAGGRYHGHVTDNQETRGFNVLFDMFIPAGTFLVQNASPQEMDLTKTQISLQLEPDFDNGEPVKVFVPPGNVTLMIKRLPDEYSIYAEGISMTVTPKSPSIPN